MRWLSAPLSLVLAAGCGPEIDIESLPETPERPQRIVGIWEGTIDLAGLRIVVHVEPADGGLSARIDSPDQGAYGIEADAVRFDGRRLALHVEALPATYSGTLDDDGTRLQGEWHQGVGIGLDLVRVDRPSERVRAQTPKPPFPYRIEEVTLPGGGPDVVLAGTLTLPPDASYPTVVLVSGSGPQDRNETMMGHQPFRVLADHLSRNGVAVLRYDDRGVAASTGDRTHAVTSDYADDAAAAVGYLLARGDIDPARVGVIGHSEGGLVVADLAAHDRGLSCGVMLAGPSVSGAKVHQEQIRRVLGARWFLPEATIEKVAALNAALYGAARGSGTWEQRHAEGLAIYGEHYERFNFAERAMTGLQPDGALMVDVVVSPWFAHFLDYDPAADLAVARVPILALYGALDLQVPASQSVPVLEAIDAGTGRFDIRVLPGLNHLFQTAETGAPDEYARIEETMAPEALSTVAAWVLDRC